MTTTPDLGIPELSQSQATPEITHNEALVMLQALLNGALDKDLTAPPGSPAEGDSYIINTATPTGAWAGQAYKVAIFWGGVWRFVPGVDSTGTTIVMGTRQAGLRIYVRDENKTYTWRGTLWSGTSYTAAEIAFTPTGTIAATDVQAAIAEAASEAVQVGGRTANSVIGRSANSSGAAADIVAGTNDRLLTQVSNALGFTQLTAGMVPANTIALAGLANAGAQYDIVGRKTASGGAWEDATRTQLLLAGTDLANSFTVAQSIDLNSAATLFNLVLTNADAGQFGAFIKTDHNSASPAAADVVGGWNMQGRNSSAATIIYGFFQTAIISPTAGADSSVVKIGARQGGAASTEFRIGNGLYTAGVTGAGQGADTLNVTALYEAGVALTAKYAQLGVANTLTALNTFNAGIVINGAPGAAGAIGNNAGFGRYFLSSIPSPSTAQFGFLNSAGSVSYCSIGPTGGWVIGAAVGGDIGIGTVNCAGVIRPGQFTVGTLPAAATVGSGARAQATDVTANTYGIAPVGSGALSAPVNSTGTTWQIG